MIMIATATPICTFLSDLTLAIMLFTISIVSSWLIVNVSPISQTHSLLYWGRVLTAFA